MRHSTRWVSWAILVGSVPLLAAVPTAAADLGGAEWLWVPKVTRYQSPAGPLFFRKSLTLGEVASAKIEVTCDDNYELYVNGTRVGAAGDWKTLESYDLTKFVRPGANTIAVRGDNTQLGAAGFVARITAKQKDGKLVTLLTDGTWKVSTTGPSGWEKPGFDDGLWQGARSWGTFNQVGPWGDRPKFPGEPTVNPDRFTPQPGFKVEEVVAPGQTGSLVAMAFDEQGQIIASRENGPLLLVRDKNADGIFESVDTYSDKVLNCQGILPLDGQVYAVGTGPAGTGLYRLSDVNRDGRADKVDTVLKLTFFMSEHGPHAVVLGPDGLLYVMIGNHASIQPQPAVTSPFRHYYNTELFTPKYEDPTGHAAGLAAPGGIVVRTDRTGSFVEMFAGGFRNAYDIAVNSGGEMFTYDSDMEYDVGLPWYRPTRALHITSGAEFGWRSGWTNWPEYYFDSLPAMINVGRGSPTGLEVYNHTRFPEKYRDALFMCDWSTGRVLALLMKPAGGSYEATRETFLEGRPLNCSDIGVGPDGWLYICVGGRGTQGSIFRVVTTDKKRVDNKVDATAEDSVLAAIRQPQLYSAWSRSRIRKLQAKLGNRWAAELASTAQNKRLAAEDRTRALDLLQIFGPPPALSLISELASDDNSLVRSKAAYLLGLHKNAEAGKHLVALLDDKVPQVRRLACEALVRVQQPAPRDKLLTLIAEPNPFITWAARRALQQLPVDDWRQAVITSSQPRVFLNGSAALLALDASRPTADAILNHSRELLADPKLSSANLLDVVRLVEIALLRADVKPNEVEPLTAQLSARYPSSDLRVNRELVRVLVYLQEPTLAKRLVEQLSANVPLEEQLHVAMHTPFLKTGWNAALRSEVLAFFEHARTLEGGQSFRSYLANATTDFLKKLTPAEQLALIGSGARTPGVTLELVKTLPAKLAPEHLAALGKLDREVADSKTEAGRELSKAIVGVLVRGDDASLAYVREVYETTPDRRPDVARAIGTAFLARKQQRNEDWQLLVRSLGVVEGGAGRDVLRALAKYPQRNNDGKVLRQVILLGLKLRDQGGQDAVVLLQHWTGREHRVAKVGELGLELWQSWFRERFPQLPDPVLPVEAAGTKWTYAALLDYLNSPQAMQANAKSGAQVYEKALCIKCHRFGTRGEGIGPDLTDVRKRFQRKEILESVLFPSAVISDLFQSQLVETESGLTYQGIIGPGPNGGITVFQSNSEKVTIEKDDILGKPIKINTSAMPEGLFNPLTLKEIADLFAYMTSQPTPNGKVAEK